MFLVSLLLCSLAGRPAKPPPPSPTLPPPRQQTPPKPAPLLELDGPIPTDFRGDPTSLVPSMEARPASTKGFWPGSGRAAEDRDWKEFWWRQLSSRRDLALRGWALFGDPASRYLEEVKNAVLASQPALREQVRVYACPSPYVNAIEMADGVVLVNLGMLARLEDESQLALVLAHEAAHHALRHVEESWWENRSSRWDGSDRWARTRFQHSRERETAADSLALTYLLASPYATSGVDSLFGILDASDNAFSRRPWTREALSTFPALPISDSAWLPLSRTTLAPAESEEGDSLHTHPAIPRRRAAAKRLLGPSPRSGQTWVVDRERFVSVREAARRGVPQGWLEAAQPTAALFEAWGQLEQRPDDPTLRRAFHLAWGDLAFDRAAARRTLPRPGRIRIWGAYQTLDHYLRNVDDAHLFAIATLALRHESAAQPQDSLAPLLAAELTDEWAHSLPRHVEYLADTTRLARSLRRQKPLLDKIRQTVPEVVHAKPRSFDPDTALRSWSGGTVVLAGIAWGPTPLARPTDGIEAGKRRIVESLRAEFDRKGVRLAWSDPTRWSAESLSTLRREASIHDWAMDRLDSRGAVRFRPRLPALRKSLAGSGADKVMVVALDWGPPEGDFARRLAPLRTAWLGNPAQAWVLPQPYLMAAVFDARDGSALGIARQQIWNENSPTAIEEHARKLARKLLDPK